MTKRLRRHCFSIRILILLLAFSALLTPELYGASDSTRVMVVPFNVNATGDLSYLRTQIASVLAKYLEQDGAVIVNLQEEDLQAILRTSPEIHDMMQIARRYGADYMLEGSFTRIGESFSIDARLKALTSTAALRVFHVQGRRLENLLNVLKELSRQVGLKLFHYEIVAQIKVEGNQRIETDAILRVVKTQVGSIYRPANLSKDLRAIYAMGYFDDLRVESESSPKGEIITFKVKEKPTIRRILIKGNTRFDDDAIRENITLSTGAILNFLKIRSNIDQIVNMYKEKNYHQVKVDYKILPLENNQADLEFTIHEGPKLYVTKITFEGNKAISSKILKKQMKTTEKGFFYWLTSSGDLDRAALDQDVARLSAYYLNHGYINARVGEPQVDVAKDGIHITIKIEEGPQYKMGSVNISGDLILSKDELLKKIAAPNLTYYSHEQVRNDVITLTDLYGNYGYAYADVKPLIHEDPAKKVVNIDYAIQKKEQVYFEKIIISGNTRTRDKVIRRELWVHEQELFNGSALKRSIRNLYRLDYFDDIKVNTLKGSTDDKMTLKIQVAEKATGTFSAGAGYSSEEDVFFVGSIAQRNLFGRGQNLQLSAQLGSSTTRFNLSFTEPWLFDTHWSTTVNAYNQEKEYENEYNVNSRGGGLRFGYPIFDYTRVYWGYSYDLSEVFDITDQAADTIRELEGTNVTSSSTVAITYDSRDRVFNPTQGSKHSLSFEYAGLGGDVGFDKYILESGWYIPLFKGFVGFIHGKGGYVRQNADDKLLPDYEKFYLGGINSLRGFDYRDVHLTQLNESGVETKIGGNWMVQFNFELIIPLLEKMGVMGVVFYDTGNVYDQRIHLNEMRASAGYGFRWYSPLAPIRLEYGEILDRREGESSGRWEFTMGGAF